MSVAVSSHAGWPALCDLGDPGWGDPRFPLVLCCFAHTPAWQVDVWFVGLVRVCGFHYAMPIPEAIQCYHLSIFFSLALDWALPMNSVFLWVLVCFCVCFAFALLFLFWVFCFGCFIGLWLLRAMHRFRLPVHLLCPHLGWANEFFATCDWTCRTTRRKPDGVGRRKKKAPMRRLQCSTTRSTFTNRLLLRATPLLQQSIQYNLIIQMEAGHLSENPQTPQQQEEILLFPNGTLVSVLII